MNIFEELFAHLISSLGASKSLFSLIPMRYVETLTRGEIEIIASTISTYGSGSTVCIRCRMKSAMEIKKITPPK